MSELHHDGNIKRETSTKQKYEVVAFYHKTKDWVDLVDELCSKFDVTGNIKPLAVVVFYLIINLCGINSSIVCKDNNKWKIPWSNFLRELGVELTRDHLQQRKYKIFLNRKLCKIIADNIDELRGEQAGMASQRPTITV